jgi:protein-L-isoaspartate(D-aspartate) O-methyltransferase
MLRADGTQVPQTTRPELIGEMLRLLDVPEGCRVLEVGTGSGYSTALLCELVGARGTVISLDIDAEMVERARPLLRQGGYVNVEILLADGRLGLAAGAPYERLVAWAATDGNVPAPWVRQVVAGGVIVTPTTDGRVLKLEVSAGPTATEKAAIRAGFIPLTSSPLRPWENDREATP